MVTALLYQAGGVSVRHKQLRSAVLELWFMGCSQWSAVDLRVYGVAPFTRQVCATFATKAKDPPRKLINSDN